jgi:hypothetical protein
MFHSQIFLSTSSLVSGAKLALAAILPEQSGNGNYRVTPAPRTAQGAHFHHELVFYRTTLCPQEI